MGDADDHTPAVGGSIKSTLSPYAMRSSQSQGRLHPMAECDLRTCYQRDRDRIIHCKSFRGLQHEDQMFLSPEGDHYRTRLTHTLEVSQVARTIARALFLNEDLTEAIALGHDLGHTPFGHVGERLLDKLLPAGFRHQEQSLRVIDHLEGEGEGLNLSWEVRDGIAHHSGPILPAPWRPARFTWPTGSPTSTTTLTMQCGPVS